MVMNKKPRKIPSKGERRNWTPVNAFVSVKLIDEVVKALKILNGLNIPNGGIYQLNNTITYRDMDRLVKNLEPKIERWEGKTKEGERDVGEGKTGDYCNYGERVIGGKEEDRG